MRKTVKYTALILAMLTVVGLLGACTTLEKDDKGMEIGVILAPELYDFDPAVNCTDAAKVKVLSLLFEGLTTLDANGKWQKALMKEYSYKLNDRTGDYVLRITLNATKWTDGRTVQAADLVYAWRRILEPDFACEAASLLYDIKNAYEAKLGDASIFDVGVKAAETYVVEVTFDHDISVDDFFMKTSSIALVPLREDIVRSNADWAKKISSIVTNGPFCLKSIENGELLRVERSVYYYLEDGASALSKEPLDKYVIPYRLINDYSVGDLTAQLEAFEKGDILYLGEIPLEARAEYRKKAVVTDELNTLSYCFNVKNALFADARVRRALSMAIDRSYIAEQLLVFADPAMGLVPGKVFGSSSKKDYRAETGAILSTSADVNGAKALLKEAGVTGGSFTLTVRDRAEDIAVAQYVSGVWEQLGFKVTLRKLSSTCVDKEKKMYTDDFQTAYNAGDFDVIAIDHQLTAPDAFAALAPFAVPYSGNGVDMDSENYDMYTHVSGYASKAYDTLIDAAYAAKDKSERIRLLGDAEKQLLDDMPIIPIVFTKDAYLASSQLSGIKSNYVGARDIKRMKQKNYYEYKMEHQVTTEE